MLNVIAIWLAAAAFAAAGVINALGTAAGKGNFVRWGYPDWWCYLTGGLEILAAVLILLPASRTAGLIFGALIIAAAIVTVVRFGEYVHLAPLGVFVVLLALARFTA